MSKDIGPWRRLSNKTVYENPWIRVEHHEVITPGGTEGIYGKVCFQSKAVGVLPLDEEGYTYLVKQFRYPLEVESWEIPEGGCPLDASAVATARKELAEETGLRAQRCFKLMDMHLSNSVCDESAEVFLALDLTQGEADLEPTEDIEVQRLALHEAIAMAMDGRITDAISVAALLKLRILLSECGGDMTKLLSTLAEVA
ncbi:NTP pyrophosphohydrolase [Spongiibacter sp. IMCC21906]|uniref:NUDIX domain-containing protein n=1 Tax=Spongiibacter sp. IMCC21906 TaxID=1620392 RepID=UPI00062DD72D|nr:NUDIX hydrolase [Spongiibacter sp. IMCC21906]AKH70097.1 NTP pyrophosphohydrolase [Spongiibacter sp. IMCC21906]